MSTGTMEEHPLRAEHATCSLAAIALCTLVYLVSAVHLLPDGFGIADARGVHGGRWWTLLTAPWIHLRLWHLAFNCYWLWFLGGRIELALGPLRWLLLTVGAALVSGMAEVWWAGGTGHGASGVVYAQFGFMALQPRDPRLALGRQVIGLMLVLLVGWMLAAWIGEAPVSNAAHVAGLAFGAALALVRSARWRAAGVAAAALLLLAAMAALLHAPHQPHPPMSPAAGQS